MRIAFVLPSTARVPVGGFKIVYEYAGRLARHGHAVKVIHGEPRYEGNLRTRLRGRREARRLRRDPTGVAPWFEFDPSVELVVAPSLGPAVLAEEGVLIATAWDTAGAVAATVGEAGFYLIQGFETWGPVDLVKATFGLPLQKIVISGWLREIVEEGEKSGPVSIVHNGLDFDHLGVDVSIESREPRVGGLLGALKGEADVIEAMSKVRGRFPALAAVTYGTRPRPPELPSWIEHVQLPGAEALRALYNSCSIFLQASLEDGWGLSATEAMACGCTLVTYDNGGSREYAHDGDTALVVAPGATSLADGIVSLLEDPARRAAIAGRGVETVSAFTWERAVRSLEDVLGVSHRAGRE